MLTTISTGNFIPFSEIPYASFFKSTSSGNIFIKLDKIYTRKDKFKVNAINVMDGSSAIFLPDNKCFAFNPNKTVLTIKNIEINVKNPFTATEEFYLDKKDSKINGIYFKSFTTYFDKLESGAVFTYDKELPLGEVFLKLSRDDIKAEYLKNTCNNDDCNNDDNFVRYNAVNLYTGELWHIDEFSVPVCDFSENIIINFNQSIY